MLNFLLVALASIVGLAASALAGEASPPKSPADLTAYAQLPNVENVTLSPSGDRIAYIVTAGDYRRLAVKDLSGALQFMIDIGDEKTRDLYWADDDHVLVGMSRTKNLLSYGFANNFELENVVALNIKTKSRTWVFANADNIFHSVWGQYGVGHEQGRAYGYFGGLTMQKTRGFDATFNSVTYVDLYRVDLDTGETRLVAPAFNKARDWALDPNGHIVAHTDYKDETGEWRLFKGGDEQTLLLKEHNPIGDISLIGLGRTPGTIAIFDGKLEERDLATDKQEEIPFVGSINDYIRNPRSGLLEGVTISGAQKSQIFFDGRLQSKVKAISKAIAEPAELVSLNDDHTVLLFHTSGTDDAGTYWLFNKGAVAPWQYSYPSIADAQVGRVSVFNYVASDGTELNGGLTLPPGAIGKTPLALVVMPHGGPESYDYVGFDWWAQAFARRGYAVFQPNFRGSSGFGREFRNAGFGEWGRKMQTDISDGVKALGSKGVIDPSRACIVGASYGGYAALAGVTLQKGLYRCAVSVGGIGDLGVMLFNDEGSGDTQHSGFGRFFAKYLGAKTAADPIVSSISPAKHAGAADAPIELIYGEDDTVVAPSQSIEMARVLRGAGKTVEVLPLKGEDHWLSHFESRKKALQASVDLVTKYNPADLGP